MSVVQLNKEQAESAKKIRDFLNDPDTEGKYFTLTGGPGTGKTFMLKEAMQGFRGVIYGGTVSHAAKNVLQQSLGTSITCFTIAQLMGMRMSINDDGTIKFTPGKGMQKTIKDADILILDEVSMIDDTLFEMIMREVEMYGIRLIAVGDKYQLPPVEQDVDSKFFDTIDAELVKPMRFTGSIQTLSKLYKDQIKHINDGDYFDKHVLNTETQRVSEVDDNYNGYVFTNDIHTVVSEAADEIKNNPDDINYARILAYKNKSVKDLNVAVRKKIYGDNLGQFEWNEIVICNGGYTYTYFDTFGSLRKMPILYNGQILRVDGWREEEEGPHGIPCLLLRFRDFDVPGHHPIYVVQDTEKAMLAYHNKKLRLEQSAKIDPRQWVKYYAFLDSFAYFDYCYAQNLYKAQGATLTSVYVCEGEVMSVKPLTWKQKFQALYVATTRAKQKLVIHNRNFY